MSYTFLVSQDVEINRKRHTPLDRDAALRKLLHQPVEALSAPAATPGSTQLIECSDTNAFADAAKIAFYEHCPLSLSPDAVWLCLARGFAEHVNLHAEDLRKRFVKHEGKIKLVVERPDFMLGQPNPWHEAFAAFSDQIAEHVGKLRDLVVADFSTTGIVERAASEVVLMDGFQGYFEYEMMCGCGIPSITLLGTPADWRSIRTRAAMFAEFGLEHWTRALLPVLDEFVRAAEGAPDIPFWQSFFHYRSGSGPSVLTGWIHVLFPHLLADLTTKKLVPNPYLETWARNRARDEKEAAQPFRGFDHNDRLGPAIDELPTSLSSAPVKLTDLSTGEVHPMRFVAGMFGVVEDTATGAVSPEIAWAVVHGNEMGTRWDWRERRKPVEVDDK